MSKQAILSVVVCVFLGVVLCLGACASSAGDGAASDSGGDARQREPADVTERDVATDDATLDATLDTPEAADSDTVDDLDRDDVDTIEDDLAEPDTIPTDTTADPDAGDAADSDDASDQSEDIADTGDATVDEEPVDLGPPVTPPAGSYQYGDLALGGFNYGQAVAFHPTGDYALVLEATNDVHIIQAPDDGGVWSIDTPIAHRITIDPPGSASMYWSGLAFDPKGGVAVLVGSERDTDSDKGVIYLWDDDTWRSEGIDGTPLTLLEGVPAADFYSAVEFPWDGGDPVVLSWNEQSGGRAAMALRELDPVEGTLTFITSGSTDAPCTDLAFVDNRRGVPGILAACDVSQVFYTETGGVPELTLDYDTTIHNSPSVAAYPGGSYAVILYNGGNARMYRFWGETTLDTDLSVSLIDAHGIEFQADGRRALIYGGLVSGSGGMKEYRHDLWERDEITDVSIPGFDAPPYSVDNNFDFVDAAWRPDCDGGLVVGGVWSSGQGRAVTFEVEGGVDCWE